MIIIKEDSNVSEIQGKIDKILADMDKRVERIHKLESKEIVLADKIRALGIEVLEYEKFIK